MNSTLPDAENFSRPDPPPRNPPWLHYLKRLLMGKAMGVGLLVLIALLIFWLGGPSANEVKKEGPAGTP